MLIVWTACERSARIKQVEGEKRDFSQLTHSWHYQPELIGNFQLYMIPKQKAYPKSSLDPVGVSERPCKTVSAGDEITKSALVEEITFKWNSFYASIFKINTSLNY